MTSFDQRFLKSITVAGKSLGNGYKAYKMDSTFNGQDMRTLVGLGTCHCCDYFLPKGDHIVLIEETQLMAKVQEIREKYQYFKGNDLDKAVNNDVIAEIQLKAYGTMLVLCRLTAKCPNVKKLIENKKYRFWLVASKIETAGEKRYFDYLKDRLRNRLTNVLGKILLDDTAVLSPYTLEEMLR